MRILLLGAGHNKEIKLKDQTKDYSNAEVISVDIVPETNPDVLYDLNNLDLPFEDEYFDEIHAYEVLEHVGRQGDWRNFFYEFNDYARVLKPGGLLCATVPRWESMWAWGDPGHTRIISEGTLAFLSKDIMDKGVGVTAMSDYRPYLKYTWDTVFTQKTKDNFIFILQRR